MKLCILCPDENVGASRQKSKIIFPKNSAAVESHLSIGVSASGVEPATHWFCFMNTTQDVYDRLLDLNEFSTIELSGPKEFLDKWELKVIRK